MPQQTPDTKLPRIYDLFFLLSGGLVFLLTALPLIFRPLYYGEGVFFIGVIITLVVCSIYIFYTMTAQTYMKRHSSVRLQVFWAFFGWIFYMVGIFGLIPLVLGFFSANVQFSVGMVVALVYNGAFNLTITAYVFFCLYNFLKKLKNYKTNIKMAVVIIIQTLLLHQALMTIAGYFGPRPAPLELPPEDNSGNTNSIPNPLIQ